MLTYLVAHQGWPLAPLAELCLGGKTRIHPVNTVLLLSSCSSKLRSLLCQHLLQTPLPASSMISAQFSLNGLHELKLTLQLWPNTFLKFSVTFPSVPASEGPGQSAWNSTPKFRAGCGSYFLPQHQNHRKNELSLLGLKCRTRTTVQQRLKGNLGFLIQQIVEISVIVKEKEKPLEWVSLISVTQKCACLLISWNCRGALWHTTWDLRSLSTGDPRWWGFMQTAAPCRLLLHAPLFDWTSEVHLLPPKFLKQHPILISNIMVPTYLVLLM